MPATKATLRTNKKETLPIPYYADTGVRLYHADVLEALNHLPDKCVDLIFADPPYNLSNDGFTCHAGKRTSVNKGSWDKSQGLEKDTDFHYTWLTACSRVLKDTGTLWVSGTYHSIYTCGYAIKKQGWHILNDICWYKPNAAPHLACRMFAASHETLLWVRKTKGARHFFNYELAKTRDWAGDFIKKNNRQMRSVWAINTPATKEKRYGKHPTQKPESLLERIVLTCSKPKSIVLDPFCGSATTGVAAIRHNRKFIGIDNEESFLIKQAIPRIEDAIKEQRDNGGLSFQEEKQPYRVLP